MKPGIAAALLFLLAVPYQTFWQDYEVARRGALAILVAVICLFPGTMPRRVPALVWPFNVLGLWVLARCISVDNFGYAMEASCHMLALATLVVFGTGLSMHAVLRAALPTGIVVACVGIAQGIGITMIPDTSEAVSTLGNRNVASELLAVCGAAAALLACDEESTRRDRGFALTAVALCALAIVLNGSRSGLLALPLGCLPCLIHARRWPMVAALALGLLLGYGTGRVAPVEKPPPSPVSAQSSSYSPSTVAVRLALWEGGLEMFANRPIVGHGGGQFLIEYPRFRTVEEIELSSFGRRFATAPASLHNDFLQILADLGLIGFLLASAAAYLLLRTTPIRMWGPFLAFLLLAGVRAPLGNAPTAALVFLFAGAMIRRQHPKGAKEVSLSPQRQVIKGIVFGLLLGAFGAGQLLSQIATTGYVEQMKTRDDWSQALASIEQALFFRPHDHNMRLLRAGDRMKDEATLSAAREDIEYLLQTAPALPAVQIQHALLLNAEGDVQGAMKVLNFLRVNDLENQRAIQVSVLILVRNRQAADAVLVLYRSRHPRTRERLAGDLFGLAGQAKTKTDKTMLLREHAFVTALDEIAVHPSGKAAMDAAKKFLQYKAPTGQKDMRGLILYAALLLAQNDRTGAETIAGSAQTRSLLPTHRRMMKSIIKDLLAIPAWRAILGDE